VKLNLLNAILILSAGLLLIATSAFLKPTHVQYSNPTMLSGLTIEFLGTIWLVLSLNRRRKKG